jgi:hypothetical protein
VNKICRPSGEIATPLIDRSEITSSKVGTRCDHDVTQMMLNKEKTKHFI